MAAETPKFKFTAVTGFFEQDHAPADPSSEAVIKPSPSSISPVQTPNFHPPYYQTTLPNLGLIDRAYDTDAEFDPKREKHQWERFTHYLAHLNSTGRAEGVSYKLLYLARHGEGYHNVKEAEVGTEAWEVCPHSLPHTPFAFPPLHPPPAARKPGTNLPSPTGPNSQLTAT